MDTENHRGLLFKKKIQTLLLSEKNKYLNLPVDTNTSGRLQV